MDVMLDIETGGTRPGSVIYSIGAVVFDTFYDESNWPTFYSPINRQSCLGYGMTEDPDTILWWDEQSEEAREVIRQANDPASLGIRVVLKNLADFIYVNRAPGEKPEDIRVWGNGASFDLVLLDEAYRITNSKQPWNFRSHRCYRTLNKLMRMEEPPRAGVKHNALDDALHQAKHGAAMLHHLEQLLDGRS